MNATAPDFIQMNPPSPERATFEGTKLKTSFFEWSITYIYVGDIDKAELSDIELLRAAETAGTFEFLNDPQEDVYNDLLPKPE